MSHLRTVWSIYGSTALFVLLWSSGAIFARLGLEHASAAAFLSLRFALAFAVLLILAASRRQWLPERGTRLRVIAAGLPLLGMYSICYLLALDAGLAPGVLATVLGVQPLLTLLLVERCWSAPRIAGLVLALGGLALIVLHSLDAAGLAWSGIAFALAALACTTVGAILQSGVTQPPLRILPLQYGVSLLACLLLVPFQPFAVELDATFLVALVWLAIVISIWAQLLFYRLIQRGNLVNVTSLFYLVPVVTAALDYACFGHRLSWLGMAGMAAILLGLMLVFRSDGTAASSDTSDTARTHS